MSNLPVNRIIKMHKPELKRIEEQAIDVVAYVVNKAKEKLGSRQTLKELVNCRESLASEAKVSLTCLKIPIPIIAEQIIADAIERIWKLTNYFQYCIKYRGTSIDQCATYYYFEGIFSQPTNSYPISQATASVFFKVQDNHIKVDVAYKKKVPMMHFRVEGHSSDHDVRYVLLHPDWLMEVIKIKTLLYRRIEMLKLF